MNWSEYGKDIFEILKKNESPFHVCFELTPFCNFQCNMCYLRLSREQAQLQGDLLSTHQWIQIAKNAKKMGAVTVEVTGGEAVTRPDFSTIYLSFVKMGYLIHLRTNGYMIKGSILELLSKYKPRKISVTLYGASDETYLKVCSIPDGFSTVSRNILAIKEAGITIRLTMTVTKDNIDDLPAVRDWAQQNGLSVAPFGGLITPIRGARRSIEHLRVSIKREEIHVPYDLAPKRAAKVSRETLLAPFGVCRGFGAVCCISWDGRMTLCNTLTDIWTEPLKSGFENAYHQLYQKLRVLDRPDECSKCKYIEYCAACPAQFQSATGNPARTNESVCSLARYKYNFFALRDNGFSVEPEDLESYRCDEGEVDYEN